MNPLYDLSSIMEPLLLTMNHQDASECFNSIFCSTYQEQVMPNDSASALKSAFECFREIYPYEDWAENYEVTPETIAAYETCLAEMGKYDEKMSAYIYASISPQSVISLALVEIQNNIPESLTLKLQKELEHIPVPAQNNWEPKVLCELINQCSDELLRNTTWKQYTDDSIDSPQDIAQALWNKAINDATLAMIYRGGYTFESQEAEQYLQDYIQRYDIDDMLTFDQKREFFKHIDDIFKEEAVDLQYPPEVFLEACRRLPKELQEDLKDFIERTASLMELDYEDEQELMELDYEDERED